MSKCEVTIESLKREKDTPVVLIDHKGFVIYVNRAFEALFGWSSEEMIGEIITMIIPQGMRDAHHLGFSRFVTTGEARIMNQTLKLAAVNRAGEQFDAEHYIVAEKVDGHWQIGATIRPLSKDSE
ncbi:PAS domain S-box-containing protein [Mariprofundus aestuarium]|uniref:PAS domain S-box-containing protein n=1 Tax=Mariprofundus aestuarium TaxID=1921086 RepID=A0A2K8L1F6_MARES|nr:PAS domain S-box protein [Mariprofundus aestuarium]ATX78764.1 PAS domain S-box-containing protein [Mariprofundus aestuarium]